MRFALTLPLALLAMGASLAACSSSTSNAVTNGPFQGVWACTVTEVLTFTTPPKSASETVTTTPTLTIATDSAGNIVSTASSDAGATCPIRLNTAGSSAAVAAGQTCTAGGLSVAYGSGTASVDGSTLTASLSYDFSGTIPATVDGGTTSETVAGTGTSTYSCTKSGP